MHSLRSICSRLLLASPAKQPFVLHKAASTAAFALDGILGDLKFRTHDELYQYSVQKVTSNK